MDEIDLQEQVGKGGFGAVYKGTWRGAIVAVKHAICNVEDAESLEQSIREVVLSKKLSHPNVVQTYAWTVLTGTELAGAVSLFVTLHTNVDKPAAGLFPAGLSVLVSLS